MCAYKVFDPGLKATIQARLQEEFITLVQYNTIQYDINCSGVNQRRECLVCIAPKWIR